LPLALLRDLDSDQFAERERATRRLVELGRPAEGALRKALEGKLSAEARRRVRGILQQIEKAPPPQAPLVARLAVLRAVELLERLDTAEARAILEEWSAGPADTALAREAKAALGRLGKRH
jgi:hypothetical protein